MASRIVKKRKRMGYGTIASLLDVLALHKEEKVNFPLAPQARSIVEQRLRHIPAPIEKLRGPTLFRKSSITVA